jgi:hypothetical protein
MSVLHVIILADIGYMHNSGFTAVTDDTGLKIESRGIDLINTFVSQVTERSQNRFNLVTFSPTCAG